MAYSTARLEKYLDYVDRFLDVDRGAIREAPNGDQYLTFKVTTTNRRQDHLESTILTHLNDAVDPDAYGIYTGPTGGKHTSTYTVILDKSNHDIDLINGRYRDYYNDMAGISLKDATYAIQPGYPTPYLIDGVPFKIDAPHSTVLGQSIAEWTKDWWIWGLHAPASLSGPPDNPSIVGNPLFDTTGEFAGLENDEPVFFVAGTFGGPPVTRTFQVPEGKPLLVPVLNFNANQFNDDQGGDLNAQKEKVNADVADWKQSVSEASLFVEIDGIRVNNLPSYFEQTDFFALGPVPEGSLMDVLGFPKNDDIDPSKSAGYWLMVEHLAPGKHTLHFGGSFEQAGETVTVDVTDYIYIT